MPGMPVLLPSVLDVAGVPVRYAVTDGGGDGDLVLVHGSGLHAQWWHAVVPLLADRWRVVTLDLSGHGDSGHRPAYSGAGWAEEVLAVAAAAATSRPVLVGHSLGGRVTLLAAARHPEQIAGLVLLDCGIVVPETLRGRTLPPPRPPKVYPTREVAVAAFRLAPPQPDPPAQLLAPVAEYGVRQVEGGWSWKHGGQRFPTLYEDDVTAAATSLEVPASYVSCGESLIVDDDKAAQVAALLPGVRTERLPGLHHHLALEDPARTARVIDEHARAVSG